MVLYEVNLAVKKSIIADFEVWLQDHVNQMLKIDGFESAQIFKVEEDEQDYKSLTVVYRLKDRECLETYFSTKAAEMREDGLKKFSNNFKATRRILHPAL